MCNFYQNLKGIPNPKTSVKNHCFKQSQNLYAGGIPHRVLLANNCPKAVLAQQEHSLYLHHMIQINTNSKIS
jgi:hypothetical protein